MNILLTNDDGIYSPGIHRLWKELRKLGKVTVVAPDTERSSVGHGITLAQPLWVKKTRLNGRFFGYRVSGTPADCVKLAVKIILKRKPDLVVSGINCGPNDGCSVHYSGTVAGAREGAIMGVPAIAVSLATYEKPDFTPAARAALKIARQVMKNGLPAGTFLNVNVPAKRLKGIRPARQGLIPIHGKFRKRTHPYRRTYYWMTGEVPRRRQNQLADTMLLQKGYVTVVPVQCDGTETKALNDMAGWDL